MSGKKADTSSEPVSSRSDSVWAALVLGLPLAMGVLWFLNQPHFEGTLAQRYVSHPIEVVEIAVFCCCVAALFAKFWGWMRQRRALRADMLPRWDGSPQDTAEAASLFTHLARLPKGLRNSWVGVRCRGILDFLCRRNTTAGLDDHVRVSADNDAMALDSSYSFIRFMIWAIPILGFLGTVLGITEAIAGVSPEQLENELSAVTGGLATAFDTTGLALMLTMVIMFLTFLVERLEQRVLQEVDGYIDEHLFHRFARPESTGSPMTAAMEHLVKRQAEIWAASMEKMQHRLRDEEARLQQRLADGVVLALDRALKAHQEMLNKQMDESLKPLGNLAGALRQQVVALKPIADGMTAMSEMLSKLHENEGQLLRLQNLLQHNLAALAEAGSFEEAVHSLTAAIHLLTARNSANLRAAA
jgi:biopolymer transport protein ExbB/TolQ